MSQLTSQLLPLGNRTYKRIYTDISNGKVVYTEYMKITNGWKFDLHKEDGPAYVSDEICHWYLNGIQIPYWVPVVENKKLIAFSDSEKNNRIEITKELH